MFEESIDVTEHEAVDTVAHDLGLPAGIPWSPLPVPLLTTHTDDPSKAAPMGPTGSARLASDWQLLLILTTRFPEIAVTQTLEPSDVIPVALSPTAQSLRRTPSLGRMRETLLEPPFATQTMPANSRICRPPEPTAMVESTAPSLARIRVTVAFGDAM